MTVRAFMRREGSSEPYPFSPIIVEVDGRVYSIRASDVSPLEGCLQAEWLRMPDEGNEAWVLV